MKTDALSQALLAAVGPQALAWGNEAAAACPLRPQAKVCVSVQAVEQVAPVVRAVRAAELPLVCFGSASRLRSRRKLKKDGYVALSLAGLAGVERLQADSLWLKARAGTPLSEICGRAGREGMRPLGFSAEQRGSLGGWLAARGRVPDPILGAWQPAVLGLEAVDPMGRSLSSVPSPRQATGSDWFSLLTGCDGAFGVVTSAVVKLEPLPERRLICGFRFRTVAPALKLLRRVLQWGWPPADAALLLQNQPRRQVRLWLRYEGGARMAAQATRWCQEEAEKLHARMEPLDRVREWQAESPAAASKVLEAPVRFSRLNDTLGAAEQLSGGFVRALLDRMDSTGGRLRVELDRRADAASRSTWAEIWDPGNRTRGQVKAAEKRLRKLAQDVGAADFLNPQAWPLQWPGGGA